METRHPWQAGPTELIEHAIEHLHIASEFNQRIAFLLLDVGVETLFKTFLELPSEVTNAKLEPGKRIRAAAGSFHELTRAMREAAGDRLEGIDLTHVQFYHGVRNKLYHQGNGVTVPRQKAMGYATTAVTLLDRLLGVDLSAELMKPDLDRKRTEQESEAIEHTRGLQMQVRAELSQLERDLGFALEQVDAAFLLPSFQAQLGEWLDSAKGELRRQLSLFVASRPQVEGDFENAAVLEMAWAPEFLAEVTQAMPGPLSRFVHDHNVTETVLTGMVRADDITQILLLVTAVAFGLPTDRVTELYDWTSVFLLLDPAYPKGFADEATDEDEDPLRLQKEGTELIERLQNLRDAIRAAMTRNGHGAGNHDGS